MQAWWVGTPGPVAGHPLVFGERPDPSPGPGEVLLSVRVCGVCRTDLHLAEGDLPPRRPGIIPGHEVVGEVLELGEGAIRFRTGERVGVAWLGGTCGRCRFCRRAEENLCLSPTFTGWDRDGGYAELVTVHEDYAYRIPDDIPPLHYGSELFQERQLRSVTANTRADGEVFLRVAAEIPLRPATVPYRLEAAGRALQDLAEDRITGAAVLHVS